MQRGPSALPSILSVLRTYLLEQSVKVAYPSGPEMSNSYPTFIDPKLDVMPSVMTGKLHVARTCDQAMDERKPVENQLDGLDSEIISSIEHSPPIRQHFLLLSKG